MRRCRNKRVAQTEVRRSQTVTMHKTSQTERKAKADVLETRGDEPPLKGWEPAEGWAEERAAEFRKCLSSFESPITPPES